MASKLSYVHILIIGSYQTRSFSAVLFRRIATKTRKDPVSNEAKELFSTLTGEQRLIIRQKLVTCLTSESVTDTRKKIGDAVAEIARQYTDNGMNCGGPSHVVDLVNLIVVA